MLLKKYSIFCYIKGGKQVEYIKLKNSSLNVSRLCMGGCPLGEYGWGKVDERELIRAVETAVFQGVNFFDTADTYGLGTSETLLLKVFRGNMQNVIIQDKFGVRAEPGERTVYDNSRKYIINACDASLKRLNTDYIDIYVIHYRDGKTHTVNLRTEIIEPVSENNTYIKNDLNISLGVLTKQGKIILCH